MACKLHSGSSGAEWQSFSLSSLSLKNQTNGQVAVISDGASDGSQTLAYYYNNSWYRVSDNFQLATSFDSLAWYDASKDSTLEISSSLVSKWNDQSPNGYNLEVLTVGRNFPQNTRLINGLTALEFVDDGTPANRTSAENASFSHDQSTEALHAFVVFHIDNIVGSQDFLLSGTSSGTNRIYCRYTNADTFQLNAGTSITSASTFSKNATYLLHLKMNDAASSIRVNGSNEASGAIGANSFNRLNVGTNYNADQGLDGAIGEIVFATELKILKKSKVI